MGEPSGLSQVAATGDVAATLRALRDRLAREIETCGQARDVAALSRQLTDVLQRIAALPSEQKGTPLDELAKRRRLAGAAAKDRARSEGGSL